MKDIIEALNNRIEELTRARDIILGTPQFYGPAVPEARPAKAPRSGRIIRRTSPGLLNGVVLEQLRVNGGMTSKEITKSLEVSKFKFGRSSDHLHAVQGALRRLSRAGTTENGHVSGRGIVHRLIKHPAHTHKVRATPQRQRGLSHKIVSVLARLVLPHGDGFTALEIVTWLRSEGYIFTTDNPQKSVTGLLSHLTKKGKVTRHKDISINSYRYKAAPTSELVVSKEG